MEIKVDTALMVQMAGNALNAKTSVENAIQASNSITVHDDWNCSERDFINDAVVDINKKNAMINEKMVSFSTKLKEIADKFVEFDNSLMTKFSGFDSAVGQMLAVENETTVTNCSEVSASVSQRISESMQDKSVETYWNQFHIGNLLKPISVLNFDDAANILNATGIPAEVKTGSAMIKEMASSLGIDL